MSRIVRLPKPHQPPLLLGHGPVHWDTLPTTVRERVLALWLQLLTEHLAHGADGVHGGETAAVAAEPQVASREPCPGGALP